MEERLERITADMKATRESIDVLPQLVRLVNAAHSEGPRN